MKKLALGLAAALIGTAAYAQTLTDSSTSGSSSAPKALRSESGTQTRTENSAAQMRVRSGARAGVSISQTSQGGDPRVRARTENNTRVGAEMRERSGVSVRSRTTVHEEPSVEVPRRRSVTMIQDEPETRTVIKHRAPAKKKVVVRKKKPHSRYVVRTSRRHVVEEPSVSVRRRTVRRYEVDEPSVSVNRRTTVRRSQDVGVSGGIFVGQRRSNIRMQSNDTNVSTTTRQRMNSETTGSVSGRTKATTRSGSGSSEQGGTRRLPVQEGGSMGGGSPKQ